MSGQSYEQLIEDGRRKAAQAVELAEQVEPLASTWLQQLESRPPGNESERQHYRNKREEFQNLKDGRLGDLAGAAELAAELARRLNEIDPIDQMKVLRDYIPAILEGEAKTARALSLVLEVCNRIDRLT
jgi:hypothetical protein